MLRRYAKILTQIESRYSVEPEVVVAIWGVESRYGEGSVVHNFVDLAEPEIRAAATRVVGGSD